MNVEQCARRALGLLSGDIRQLVASDPLAALGQYGLTVSAVHSLSEARRDGGSCDGMSFLRERVVLYAPTPNSRRENFTLTHELGHYLVNEDEDSINWLADQPHSAVQLESVCDRIAQALLLPDHVVKSAVDGPVGVDSVLSLFDGSAASRPACAIAIATGMPCLGAVVIIDPATWTVTFSSVHPDPDRGWPEVFPWTNQPVPSGHPLKALTPGSRLQRRSSWATPWGATQPYYIDAQHDGRRVLAVLAERDLWGCERLHLDAERDYLERPTREVTCCGSTQEVRGYPCAACGGGYCRTCQRCSCDRAGDREQRCNRCFLMYQPHLLVDGVCLECR